MKRILCVVIVASVLLMAGGAADDAECGHRLGGGLRYLTTLGDIKDFPEWDANSFGFIASYQYDFSLIKIEGDVEWILDYGGSDKSLIQPQAWLVVGNLIYGAGGIGMSYLDGNWFDDPFYGLRAGTNLTLLGLNFDAFASYQFQSTKVFEHIDQEDLDALTFGLILRFVF